MSKKRPGNYIISKALGGLDGANAKKLLGYILLAKELITIISKGPLSDKEEEDLTNKLRKKKYTEVSQYLVHGEYARWEPDVITKTPILIGNPALQTLSTEARIQLSVKIATLMYEQKI